MPSAPASPEAGPGNSPIDTQRVRQIVRTAAKSIYGVRDVVGPRWYHRAAGRLKMGNQGVAVDAGTRFSLTVDIVVASGVPADKVAANVADRVRYVMSRDIGRRVDELSIRVDGRPMPAHPGGSGA